MSLSHPTLQTSDFADLELDWSAGVDDWMRALASQYYRARRNHPNDRLIAVFDIDGTILDMRQMVRWVLLSYDRVHETEHFRGLQPETITVHENHIDRFLRDWPLPPGQRERVLDYYAEHAWSDDAIMASHQPYRGVLDVIRWFQIQPETYVGLNTGRPESFRDVTLNSLNILGAEYRVQFSSELLVMCQKTGMQHVPLAKADGLQHFREAGYRVFAVIDNEPENIESMVQSDPEGEILFLHADTIFESKRSKTPRTVRGRFYDITNLVSEEGLPQRVEFVWHGIGSRADMRKFLASGVRWGEVHVRRDPLHRLVVRRLSFEDAPWMKSESHLLLEDCLREVHRQDRALKLDLKEGGELVDQVETLLSQIGLTDNRLWFNGGVEVLGMKGIQSLRERHPGAVIQCPVDCLSPLIHCMTEKAREILEEFAGWGVNRFSVSWKSQDVRRTIELLESWGFDVNIYDVPSLEAFLQAALLLPRSLTSDFNFPKWSRFGG